MSADQPFQTFEEPREAKRDDERLALLRAELAARGLDGLLVPRSDEHQNEYVAPGSERLAWLTGFLGSAGLAVAMRDQAALFVDGRYGLQAREQTSGRGFACVDTPIESAEAWIARTLKAGQRIGYDPWLLTAEQVAKLEAAAAAAGAGLVALDDNPIDAIWSDRPASPNAPVESHDERFAGRSAAQKIAAAQEALGRSDGLMITDPHAIAWLFNIRGADVAHTPLPLAFALLPRAGRPTLFIAPGKLDSAMRKALEALADLAVPEALLPALAAFAQDGRSLRFDKATAPAKLSQAYKAAGGAEDAQPDPLALMKARKNDVELAGARAAHLRDGAAMVKFLHWLEGAAPSGQETEITAARKLEAFRRQSGLLRDLSFPAISAAGPHSAIPHYRVTSASCAQILPGLYLIDSGAQYRDGTTDITRTVAIGPSTQEMRDRFTRVLKGHIAIALAVFPAGTAGAQIDALARVPLWEAGLDFDHGTGHGVGSYLSVHEGPQRLAKTGAVALEPGMIVSNEPGYYKAGHWGIRIENLVVVEPRAIPGAERAMLGFETISLCPIDRALIDDALLTRFEVAWLDAYHARTRACLTPLLDAADAQWLARATMPISKV